MNFVVIALPRTGSTHLTKLLDQEDSIACQGEIFHPKKIFLRWPKKDRSDETIALLTELRQRQPVQFLDRILSQTYGSAHVGFKIFPGHNDEILWHVAEDRSIRKIVLLRANFLASYSSSLIRQQRREGETTTSNASMIHFNPDKFLLYCDKAANFYRCLFERLTQTRQGFRLVHYEEINDPWFFAGLVAFIGGNPTIGKMGTGRQKQNSLNIISRFANSGDVAEFLTARGLMHWEFESVVSLDPLGNAGSSGNQAHGQRGSSVPGDDTD